MNCINCFADTPQIGITSLTYEREGSAIHVRVEGIPAEICPACNEVYLSEAVAQQIFELVSPLLKAGETMDKQSILPAPTVVIQFPPLEPAQLEKAVAVA